MSPTNLLKIVLLLIAVIMAVKVVIPLLFGATIFLIKLGVLFAVGFAIGYVVRNVVKKNKTQHRQV